MPRRSMIWAGALLVLLATAVAFDPPALGWEGVVLGVLLLVGLAMLVRSLVTLVGKAGPEGGIDERPADGEVPLVALPGADSIENEERPTLKAFVRLAPSDLQAGRSRPGGRLLGRVALVSVFVGRDGSDWSPREVVEAFDSLVRTGRWLEREAMRWGTPLNLEVVDTYFTARDEAEEIVALETALDPFQTTIDEADVDLRGVSSASRAAARLGFSDLAEMIGQVEARLDHDRIIWFVHLLREGRSRAIPPGQLGLPGSGLALCYARESPASAPLVGIPYVDPITLAHELLHLFGASDKYGTPLATFPRGSVTSRDIMRLDVERLGRLQIGPMTACEIGWIASLDLRAENRPASPRG